MAWIYIPNESCPSVPASECSTSESKKDCDTSGSIAELWVSASGKVTQRPHSWRGWKTRPWSQRLFRTISTISMNGGEDALIGLWLDSHANRGPSQATKPEKTTNDGYGTTSCESSTSPKPPTSSSKTCQDSPVAKLNGEHWWTDQKSLFGETDLIPFFDRWPKEGSMLSGAIYKQKKWVPAIVGNECLCWPTSQAGDFRGGMGNQEMLPDAVKCRATPNVPNRGPETKESKANRPEAGGIDLQAQVMDWTTPQAHDTNKRSKGQTSGTLNNGAGNACLATDAEDWGTPAARERTHTPREVDHGIQLANQVDDWATPAARDFKGAVTEEALIRKDGKSRMDTVDNQATHFLPPAETENSGTESSKPTRTSRPRLNPAFDCWLMGMPWFWTHPEPINFAVSEILSWRFKLRLRLSCLLNGL